VEEFNIRIGDLLGRYEPCLVRNMDETSWKLINTNITAMAEWGRTEYPGDSQSCGIADRPDGKCHLVEKSMHALPRTAIGREMGPSVLWSDSNSLTLIETDHPILLNKTRS
jgi:hypothetical protein